MVRALVPLCAVVLLLGCKPKPLPEFGSTPELSKVDAWAVGYWTVDEESLSENLRGASRRSAVGRVGEQFLDLESAGSFRYSTTSRNGHSVHVDGQWKLVEGMIMLEPKSVDGAPIASLSEGAYSGAKQELSRIVEHARTLGPLTPHEDRVRMKRSEPSPKGTIPSVWRRVRFF